MASTSKQRRGEALRRRQLAPNGQGGSGPARVREPRGDKPRYHAIDALRGTAMFLVIGLHAALGYLERDIPGVLWCVRDSPTVPAFDWFCWWCMSISNPLYFTIAGFFAVHLYDSRGPRGFANNRARRVLVPFLVALCTVGPASLLAWSYGWLLAGRCSLRQIRKLRFLDPQIQAEILGPGHLWFLEYLLLMLAAYAAYRHWVARRGPGGDPARTLAGRVVGSPWRPLLLALPTAVLLWISRKHLGVDSVLDRHNSFLPDPVRFLHHGSFFLVGAVLYRLRDDLGRLARVGPWYVALALPVFAGRAWLLNRDWTRPLDGAWGWALAGLGALFAWLIVFGLIGVYLRLFRESRPSIVYLADSSYWIYLVHMPIIGFLQVDLSLVPGHALWKFPVVLAVTLAVGFASYHTLVRYTAIGTWLHGRRERPALQGA